MANEVDHRDRGVYYDVADDIHTHTHVYNSSRYWSNPFSYQLPSAPSLTIYCLYGVGSPAERSFFYKQSFSKELPQVVLNTDIQGGSGITNVRNGVTSVDGDGTVPLLSLGYPSELDGITSTRPPES
eukprot:GHVR01152595.1.p1 GENE.GHVR01152595.1~~GHVR01152595.1.p1  ORF type:complete len:127 (+),score=42.56 GHVR01152595.1:351-731(+)